MNFGKIEPDTRRYPGTRVPVSIPATRVPVHYPGTRVFISTRILYVKKYKNVYNFIVYYLRLPSHKYGAQISGGSRNIGAIGNLIFR